MNVPNDVIRGKRGARIDEITSLSGASINIIPERIIEHTASSININRIIEISGSTYAVTIAKSLITIETELERENCNRAADEDTVAIDILQEKVIWCIHHICGSLLDSPSQGEVRLYPDRTLEMEEAEEDSSLRRERGGGRGADREAPEPNKSLCVFGLSLHTTEKELEKHFSTFGRIEKCRVAMGVNSGRSRGFAFIDFESIDDAMEARKEMDGKELDGRPIRTRFAKDFALRTFEEIADFVRRLGGGQGRADIINRESK